MTCGNWVIKYCEMSELPNMLFNLQFRNIGQGDGSASVVSKSVCVLRAVMAANVSDFADHSGLTPLGNMLPALEGLLPSRSFGRSQLLITALDRTVGQTLAPKPQ